MFGGVRRVRSRNQRKSNKKARSVRRSRSRSQSRSRSGSRSRSQSRSRSRRQRRTRKRGGNNAVFVSDEIERLSGVENLLPQTRNTIRYQTQDLPNYTCLELEQSGEKYKLGSLILSKKDSALNGKHYLVDSGGDNVLPDETKLRFVGFSESKNCGSGSSYHGTWVVV